MKQLVWLLLFTCSTTFIQSQSIKPVDLVNDAKTKLTQVDLVQPLGRTSQEIPEEVKEYQLLSLDANATRNLLSTRQEGISITIPKNEKEQFTLQLVEVDLPLFTVRTVSDNELAKYQGGKHFRGIIRGDEQSIVSLSVFNDGIMGLISESGNKGNWVLGELKGSEDYIFYNDPQIQNQFSLECGTEDSYKPYSHDVLNSHEGIRALTDCVGLYFEVDYDIYLDKGSNITSVTNYITGLYNQVATLYSNENINTNISEIVIWDVPSPYNSTTSIGMLNQFTAYRQGFNGDLAMLLSYQASGGVAYVNGLCSSNPDYSMSFSSINSTYQNVPTYSWSVMVVAHEFGHLFGSQHTHACVWNGNNTAIDGCYATEGGCSNPGIPSNGGTIMSYCHLTSAGINLNLGFGPQPGNVIRASVTTASCLQSCGGGGNPPAGCTDNQATLNILLDNYPGETTWSIKNNAGATLYSGGPYSTPATLITVDICQPDGCYDFVINDSYGDGICCGYGQGYYEIVFNGNVLANGGQFGSSETKNFCLSGGNAPTCNDGIQNGDETGVDCGGSSCPACPTCNDGIQNGDETGVDCGGSSCPACPTCNDGIQNGDETGVDCGGSSCPVCPTCNDGIQNGDETGVDCGGSTCPPCSSGCNGTEVTIQIVLDNYPGETTWNLKNSNGVTVVSGGPYNGQSGQTIAVIECLPDGCYDFNIFDSYGDGICCAYGYGNYNVFSGSTTYASGGQFGSVETTNFCLGNNPPTCNDGIQNGDETGVDCGGSTCPACPTCNDGIQNGDETGVDCGGTSCPPCTTCNDGIQNGDETGVDCGGSTCPPCTTCNDGIQNGDETGVDCGGSTCPPCTTCNDGIQNGDETGVDCGGSTCPACPTCNDGIQNGDETGVDCGGSSCPACPTCNDGIQNGDETGVDCGGTSCPPCGGSSTTTIAAHYFETGWDNWVDGGSDCYRNNSSSYAYEGSYSIRLRDNSGIASSMTSEAFDLTQFNIVSFDFYFYPYSMEPGEDFSVQYYDGSSWITLANYVSGTDFMNYSFYNATITINNSSVNFPTDAQFRIQCDASTNSDRVYIDAITIEGSTGSPLFENTKKMTQLRSGKGAVNNDILSLTPNPARDYISIEIFDEEETIGTIMAMDVFDMMGRRVISQRNVDDLEFLRLDVSQLSSGSYIIRLNTDGEEVLTKRFQVVRQ